MFDDRKATGNPGRITCCGAQGESQQQFPDEAPNSNPTYWVKRLFMQQSDSSYHVARAMRYSLFGHVFRSGKFTEL